MEICDIEKMLNRTQYESFIGTFQKVILKDFVYPILFKICTGTTILIAQNIGTRNESQSKNHAECSFCRQFDISVIGFYVINFRACFNVCFRL